MRKPNCIAAYGGGNSNAIDVATTVSAKGGVGRMDFESETFVTHALTAEGFDASEDGTGRGVPLVPVAYRTSSNCGAWETGDRTDALTTTTDPSSHVVAIPIDMRQASRGDKMTNNRRDDAVSGGSPETGIGCPGDPAPSLGGSHTPAVAFSCKDSGADASEVAPTMRSMSHDGSHANAGGQLAVAVNLRGREDGAQPEVSDIASLRSASGGSSRSYAATEMSVRRLTVVECCRLQGFEDTYCHVKYGRPRKIDADEAAYLTHHGIHCWQDGEQWMTDVAADGSGYRALGNSFPVPVIRWLGKRIQAADEALR